jgi:hypothetical protein
VGLLRPTQQAPRRGYAFENPAASRYLYVPSAIPLNTGEGYISQKELIFTSAAIGVSDNFSILAGMPIPWNLFALREFGEGAMVIGGAKAGFEVQEGFWMGGGVEAFIIADTSFGIAFANATAGNRDSNFTVGLGAPFFEGEFDDFLGFIVVAGQLRVNDGASLIFENWVAVSSGDFGGIFTAGIRLIRPDITVDLALMAYAGGSELGFIPIPWVDFAWHFGG